MKYSLLPLDQLKIVGNESLNNFPESNFDIQSFSLGRKINYFYNAKEAIHYILKKLALKREDEVYISTTSDSNFVSTCVSATIFNYTKISRVLTEKTKLIFVIHEFGFYNEKTKELSETAKKMGIPMVEDSAHSLATSFNGDRVGKYADYTIFSLPKSIPVQNGGILLSNETIPVELNNSNVENGFKKYLGYVNTFNQKRQELYNYLNEKIKYKSVFGDLNNNIPFAFVFESKKFNELNTMLEEKNIQVLRTYNREWVGIPVNSFLNTDEFTDIITLTNNY